MAKGGGARRGFGIAFQGKADQPTYLLQQAQNQAKRRRAQRAAAQKAKAQEQQDALEDYEGLDADIHPVWNPIKNRVKQEFFDKVKQLRKQNPDNFRNTDEYQQYLREARLAFNQLKEKTKEWRDIRKEIQENENAYFNPEITRAMKTGNLKKLQEATGNELGLWGESLTFLEDVGKMASDAAEQAGGLQDVAMYVREANKGQLERVTKKELPDSYREQLEQYWSNPNTRKALKTQGIESKEQWLDEGVDLVIQEARELEMVGDPTYEGGGGRGGYGDYDDTSIFSGISRMWRDIEGQSQTNTQAFSNLGAQARLKPSSTETTNFAYDYSGPGVGKAKKVQTGQIFKPKGEGGNLTFALEKEGEKERDKPVAVRTREMKIVPGYYSEGNELRIAKTQEELENNQIQPVVQAKVEPIKATGEDNEALFEDARKKLEKQKGDLYQYFPLNERGVASDLDQWVNSPREFEIEQGGSGNAQRQQPQGNQQQGQQQNNNQNRGSQIPKRRPWEVTDEELIQQYSK